MQQKKVTLMKKYNWVIDEYIRTGNSQLLEVFKKFLKCLNIEED